VVLLEAAVVAGVLALVVYLTIRLLTRPPGAPGPSRAPRSALPAGEWRVDHVDVDGRTRVLLQKVLPGSGQVVDEHVVATIPVDDPDYDEAFLRAMATARERRALFESEHDP
jgi:hypothetical protein